MNFQQYCYTNPSDEWKDRVFFGVASGMLNYAEYMEFLGMVTQLKIKAKENIDKGIIKIPHYNFCQEDELARNGDLFGRKNKNETMS